MTQKEIDQYVVQGYNAGKSGEERTVSDTTLGDKLFTGFLLGGPVGLAISVFVPSPEREDEAQKAYDRGYELGQRDHAREVIREAREEGREKQRPSN